MSRCFPYPPPGFEKKHDPLIESSIKLSKEKSRDKKERKKERKEKKREKKEKSVDATVKKEDKKHGHKKRHREERKKLELNGKNQSNEKVEEIEQLERSSLTEEQGLPSSQYLCDSPDSSQNSSKRIKLDATEAPVSVLRIRLSSLKQVERRSPLLSKQPSFTAQKNIGLPALSTPLAVKENAEFDPVVPPCLPALKQRDAAPSVPEKEPCFSGRTVTIHGHNESNLQIDAVVQPWLPPFRQRDAAPSVPQKEPCFSGRIETTNAHKESNDVSLFQGFKGSSKSRKREVEFRNLMANWHPQPIQIDQAGVEDDQDWLFGGCAGQQELTASKETAVESKVPVQGEVLSSWPPRACHHPEADVFVLPYVLPF